MVDTATYLWGRTPILPVLFLTTFCNEEEEDYYCYYCHYEHFHSITFARSLKFDINELPSRREFSWPLGLTILMPKALSFYRDRPKPWN